MIYDPATRLYAVIGNPVRHSASPRLFNTLFAAHRFNGVYLAFEHTSVKELMAAMRALSIAGFSVTIPFKEEVMGYLDAWDESARCLGCANTVWNDEGRLVGYNFDGKGALAGLEDFSENSSRNWREADIYFLGNGGAARGILLTLIGEQGFRGRVFVIARSPAKTEKLVADAASLGSDVTIIPHPWEWLQQKNSALSKSDRASWEQGVVINTTSLGMSPHAEVSPVPAHRWTPEMVAYDVVYNPLHTLFLKEAEAAGAHTITGLNMFLGQARLQFQIWTGIEVAWSQMHRYFRESSQ